MATPHWYIARNKVRVGPFTASDLKQLASCGLLRPAEFVWREGSAKWVEAVAIPGLFPEAGQKRYWLALAGQTRGPYVGDQIRAALATRQLSFETPVCLEGGDQWQPLNQHVDFRAFQPSSVPPSRAQLLLSTLDMEEATLHLAGKSGDAIAKLICTLMDLKRNYAHNTALVENLDKSIQVLQAKREKEMQSVPAVTA
jgi:hypothetical protein